MDRRSRSQEHPDVSESLGGATRDDAIGIGVRGGCDSDSTKPVDVAFTGRTLQTCRDGDMRDRWVCY
jgi:hypothetical protein